MLRSGALAGVVWASLALFAYGARPVAFIFQVKGDVQIQGEGGPARKAAMFGGAYPGDKLVVPAGASVSLRFATDGHREQVSTEGEWTLAADELQPRENVQLLAATSDQSQPLSQMMRSLADSGVSSGKLGGVTVARSGEHDGPAVSPLDTEVVLTQEVTLSWPPRAGVEKYRVFVNSNGKKVWSGTSSETKTAIPAGLLQPGTRYDWQVVDARPGGGGIIKASFTMAFSSQQAQARLLKQLAADGAESLAFAALTCESQRFYSLAISLYEELSKNSNDAAFHAALSELYARAGRMADAQSARTKAEGLGFVFAKPAQVEPPTK